MTETIRETMIINEKEAIEMTIDKETKKEIGIEIEIEKGMNQKRNINQCKKTKEMIDFQKEKKEVTQMIDLIMMIINLMFLILGITRIIQMIRTRVKVRIIQAKTKNQKKIIIEGSKNE